MAVPDSTTTPCAEITCPTPICEPSVDALLKIPFGATLDLFQLLDCCQNFADALTENDNDGERIALCGRLYAALNTLQVVLKAPLPAHLIARLTADEASGEGNRCPLSTDSETLREYCAALTMLLLQRQQSPEQESHISGLLYELVCVLVEDVKAPRFVRTAHGLAMMADGTKAGVH